MKNFLCKTGKRLIFFYFSWKWSCEARFFMIFLSEKILEFFYVNKIVQKSKKIFLWKFLDFFSHKFWFSNRHKINHASFRFEIKIIRSLPKYLKNCRIHQKLCKINPFSWKIFQRMEARFSTKESTFHKFHFFLL